MEFHLKKKLFLKDTSLSERFISSKSDVTFFKVLIYISTLEILPSSEGFLFNYTYL